jgi:hypothetical protein
MLTKFLPVSFIAYLPEFKWQDLWKTYAKTDCAPISKQKT